jgi:type IV secretion system protein VirB8
MNAKIEHPKMSKEEYYQKAASWAEDMDQSRQRNAKLGWTIAGVAIVIALFEAVALIAMAPLKTVVPYTLMVDRQTGYVVALDPLKPTTISSDDALTRSFLAQYVIARESFEIDNLQGEYRKVSLWSSGKAKKEYSALMNAQNPNSPLKLYSRKALVQTRVKSISPLNKTSSLVRFETFQNGGSSGFSNQWVAIIKYRYSKEPLDMESRLLNPIGFQVTEYRRDSEAPPPVESSYSSTSAAPVSPMTPMASPPAANPFTVDQVAPRSQ